MYIIFLLLNYLILLPTSITRINISINLFLDLGSSHAHISKIYIDNVLKDEHIFNSINEAVTLGLVPSFQHVERGQMIGTLKIIPFAISGGVMNEIEKFSIIHQPLFNLRPYAKKTAMLIQTQLTTTKGPSFRVLCR